MKVRKKLLLAWKYDNGSTQAVLDSVEFDGSDFHCVKEAIRWFYKKGFLSLRELFGIGLSLDSNDYARESRRLKQRSEDFSSMVDEIQADVVQ